VLFQLRIYGFGYRYKLSDQTVVSAIPLHESCLCVGLIGASAWNSAPNIYRVAQIKIPQRTKRNFSTTVWDFLCPNFLTYMGEILLQLWFFFKLKF